MKVDLGKILFLILFLTLSAMTAVAGTIKGTITDKQTKEPLTGATVQVVGTTQGAVADIDGNYTLQVPNGTYDLIVRYVGYVDITANGVKVTGDVVMNFEMESDSQTLGEVSVTARKNLESERALQVERQKATLAIENLGAKEMSLKGIGNVQEGVKQITGVSIADAGQLIVDMSIGAVSGAFGGSAIGVGGMTVASFATGAAGSLASDWVAEEELDFKAALTAGAMNAVFTAKIGMGGVQYGKTAGHIAAKNTLKTAQRQWVKGVASAYKQKQAYKSAQTALKSAKNILKQSSMLELTSRYAIGGHIVSFGSGFLLGL